MNNKLFAITGALTANLLFAYFALPAAADDQYAEGALAYQKKQYGEALIHFNRALQTNPGNSNALYYKAVSLAQLGQQAEAKKIYIDILSRFAGSDAARGAQTAMNYLDTKSKPKTTPEPAGSPAPKIVEDPKSTLPPVSKIRFEYRGDRDIMIPAKINNAPTRLLLDFGADEVAFDKSQLDKLGVKTMGVLRPPAQGEKPSLEELRKVEVAVKIGDIERRNFSVTVSDKPMPDPLLGKAFFFKYEYEIDYNNAVLTLTRAGGIRDDRNAIPYNRVGRDIVVKVDFGGKSFKCVYDPRAEGTNMTINQAKGLGLNVPEFDPEDTSPKTIFVPTVKCGPIIKSNVEITLFNDPARDRDNAPAILGKGFFGDRKFSIDEATHFMRLK